jgi:hypothetical protein
LIPLPLLILLEKMLEVDESPSEIISGEENRADEDHETQQSKKRSHEEREEEEDNLNSRFQQLLNQATKKETPGPEYRSILPYLDLVAEGMKSIPSSDLSHSRSHSHSHSHSHSCFHPSSSL